jgi:hypothetical protein
MLRWSRLSLPIQTSHALPVANSSKIIWREVERFCVGQNSQVASVWENCRFIQINLIWFDDIYQHGSGLDNNNNDVSSSKAEMKEYVSKPDSSFPVYSRRKSRFGVLILTFRLSGGDYYIQHWAELNIGFLSYCLSISLALPRSSPLAMWRSVQFDKVPSMGRHWPMELGEWSALIIITVI